MFTKYYSISSGQFCTELLYTFGVVTGNQSDYDYLANFMLPPLQILQTCSPHQSYYIDESRHELN